MGGKVELVNLSYTVTVKAVRTLASEPALFALVSVVNADGLSVSAQQFMLEADLLEAWRGGSDAEA